MWNAGRNGYATTKGFGQCTLQRVARCTLASLETLELARQGFGDSPPAGDGARPRDLLRRSAQIAIATSERVASACVCVDHRTATAEMVLERCCGLLRAVAAQDLRRFDDGGDGGVLCHWGRAASVASSIGAHFWSLESLEFLGATRSEDRTQLFEIKNARKPRCTHATLRLEPSGCVSMANAEHLSKLEEGVTTWNEWREAHPSIVPDLSGADLSGTKLAQANLYRAELIAADLGGANLSGASLSAANLSGADLIAANVSGANLSGANLAGADLDGADIHDADLTNADLFAANLTGTNLTDTGLDFVNFSYCTFLETKLHGATLQDTIFQNVDLSKVVGLDSCDHWGPSALDHRTLQRSGPLPDVFLRGCGLPDVLIDFLPSLFGRPSQHYSCFISYSSQDDEFAIRLHSDLQDNGVRCWFAPEDMRIGDRMRTRIDEVIRVHDKLLLVLSETSVASAWVEKEVETAFEKERERNETVLSPIRLDGAVMDSKTGWAADIKRTRHIGDFTNWKTHDEYIKSFDRLLRDLKLDLGRKEEP